MQGNLSEVAKQRLETSKLQRWVELTSQSLEHGCELLNDLNTFPVANFNTGANLLATWRPIAATARKLPASLPVGRFIANLAVTSAQYPKGSSGIFVMSALHSLAKTWQNLDFLRPTDLVLAAETIETDFQALGGSGLAGNGLTFLAAKISEQLASLELLTLTAVTGTALVCAQEITVDSADSNQGVGDAGLAGASLILAALADVAAETEDEPPVSRTLVHAMLSEWADRSRPVTKALRRTPPGGEFAVTFHCQGYAADLDSYREALAATCSEVLVHTQTDDLGLARFIIHVHTPAPLSALPHPHEDGVLIAHLSPPTTVSTEEDPVESVGNVVMFSRAVTRSEPRVFPRLVVLSEAPAMTETLARSGATVLLHATAEEHLKWALENGAVGQPQATLVIPGSESTRQVAQQVKLALSGCLAGANPGAEWLWIAPSDNELAAARLVERLGNQELRGDLASQLASLEVRCEEILSEMRVEEFDAVDPVAQLESLLSFSASSEPEILAIIGANQAAVDRANLQLAVSSLPQVSLTTYYGGQTGPTVIGVR